MTKKQALMRCAVHELGHAYVALQRGAPLAIIKISKRTIRSQTRGGTVTGECQYGPLQGKLSLAAVAVAGGAAVALLDDRSITAKGLWQRWLTEVMISESDFRLISKTIHISWRFRAAALALRLLRKHWRSILRDASDLSRNPDGMLFLEPDDL